MRGSTKQVERRTTLQSIGDIDVLSISYAISLVLVFKPYLVQLNETVDQLWDICSVLVFSICIVSAIIARKTKAPHALLLLFLVLYVGVTYFNVTSNTVGALSESIRVFSAFLIPGLAVSWRPVQALRITKGIIVLLIYLSGVVFITNWFFDYLLGNNYSLFGLDNYEIFYLIPMLAIVLAINYGERGRYGFHGLILIGIVVVPKVVTGALTSIVALAVFCALLIAIRFRSKIVNSLSIKVSIGIAASITVLIVFFNVQYVFSDLMGTVGRDVTLSYRTVIWSGVIDAIARSPLLGYGQTLGGTFQLLIGLSPIYDSQASHAHNYLLELLMYTGISGLILYIGFLLSCFSGVYREGRRRSSTCRVLQAGIVAFAILMITDSYVFTPPFYIALSLLYSIPSVQASNPFESSKDKAACTGAARKTPSAAAPYLPTAKTQSKEVGRSRVGEPLPGVLFDRYKQTIRSHVKTGRAVGPRGHSRTTDSRVLRGQKRETELYA